jgi:hypothetical protein
VNAYPAKEHPLPAVWKSSRGKFSSFLLIPAFFCWIQLVSAESSTGELAPSFFLLIPAPWS